MKISFITALYRLISSYFIPIQQNKSNSMLILNTFDIKRDHPLNCENPISDLSAYQANNMTQFHVYDDILHLFESYYQQHNIRVILRESKHDFCTRKFVRTTKSYNDLNCVGGIGNQLGSFLQDFLYAIVTNRTFTIPSYRANLECKYGYTFMSWIPTYDAIKTLYQQQCKQAARGPILGVLSCGALDVPYTVVDPASDHDHNSHYLVFRRAWDHNISDAKLTRINILFNPTFNDNDRFFAYGFLQLYAINLTSAVRAPLQEILSKTLHVPDSIRISLHIRHYGVKENIEEKIERIDHEYMKSLVNIREKFLNKTCFIYLATEREQTMTRILSYASSINCTVYHINRNDRSLTSSDINTTTTRANESHLVRYRPVDHGAYGIGILPFSDFWLLQYGDVLLGTSTSTFSILIANVVALTGLKKGIDHSSLFWDNGRAQYSHKPPVYCVHMIMKDGRHWQRCYCLPPSSPNMIDI